MPQVQIGAGVGGIASAGTTPPGKRNGIGSVNINMPKLLKDPHTWAWIIFGFCVAWLVGLFAAFGGYKGDVAS